MNPLRRSLLRALALSPCTALPVVAQTKAPSHRVAWLARNPFGQASLISYPPNPRLALFQARLAELGFVQGRNLELRSFLPKSLEPEHVAEALRQAVDWKPTLIKVRHVRDTLIAKQVTSTVPIVFSGVGDPVAVGIVQSLAKPGGNATGVAMRVEEMAVKRLEMAREIVPGVRKVGLFFDSRSAPGPGEVLRALDVAAARFGIAMERADLAQESGGLRSALEKFGKSKCGAAMPVGVVYDQLYKESMVAFQASTGIPVIEDNLEELEAGAVAAIYEDDVDHYRRAGDVAAKILNGALPGTIPVDVTVRVTVALNLRSARALGITLPQSLLVSADRVIK